MPRYDYECLTCHERFEEFARIAERGRTRCACGGKTKRLLLSPPNVSAFRFASYEPDTGQRVEFGNRSKAADWLRKRGLHAEGITHLRGHTEHDGKLEQEAEKRRKIERYLQQGREEMIRKTGRANATLISEAKVDKLGMVVESRPIGVK